MQSGNSERTQERSFIERARRDQIVQATLQTLADVGYARTSFTRIAARASISPSLISYHFADRAELMSSAGLAVIDDLQQALRAAGGSARSYPEALAGLISGNVHYAAEHLMQLRALAELRAAGAAPEQGRRRAALSQLEELLTDGQAAGGYGPFNARVMAMTLLAALEAVPTALADDPDLKPDLVAEELIETFRRATAVD